MHVVYWIELLFCLSQAHSLTTEYSTTFVQKIVYFFAALGKELNLFHCNKLERQFHEKRNSSNDDRWWWQKWYWKRWEKNNNNDDDENVKTNQRVHPQPARSRPSLCWQISCWLSPTSTWEESWDTMLSYWGYCLCRLVQSVWTSCNASLPMSVTLLTTSVFSTNHHNHSWDGFRGS